jgi:hypothetical protein
MKKKESPKAAEVLKNLNTYLYGPGGREPNAEEARRIAAEAGIDTSKLYQQVREMLASARGKGALARAREKRLKLLGLRKALEAGLSKPEILERVKAFFDSNPELAHAYRKFKSAKDSDLKTLLEDINLLEKFIEEDKKR